MKVKEFFEKMGSNPMPIKISDVLTGKWIRCKTETINELPGIWSDAEVHAWHLDWYDGIEVEVWGEVWD